MSDDDELREVDKSRFKEGFLTKRGVTPDGGLYLVVSRRAPCCVAAHCEGSAWLLVCARFFLRDGSCGLPSLSLSARGGKPAAQNCCRPVS